MKAIVSVQKVKAAEKARNPLGKSSNSHEYRDAAARGRVQGAKARAGKVYSGCPYVPNCANMCRKRSTLTFARAKRNHDEWMMAFEATAGFKFTPYVKKAS